MGVAPMTDSDTPRPPFDQAWTDAALHVFGVKYICVPDGRGGDVYVTREGWPLVDNLLPERWYDGKQYARRGYRLPGGTGAVYRVDTHDARGRAVDLVVKFCRFAQEVPLMVPVTQGDGLLEQEVANARFNSPFEEFGLLRDLRRGGFGPPDLRIRTKRPLAIYCPPKHHKLWQLGRTHTRCVPYVRRQERAQHGHEDRAIHLHEDRDYIMLFAYIKGENAEELAEAGVLTDLDLLRLSARVRRELALKGFYVLDNKPKHYILRRRARDGSLLRRNGRLVYGLVDFELMHRTHAYRRYIDSLELPVN